MRGDGEDVALPGADRKFFRAPKMDAPLPPLDMRIVLQSYAQSTVPFEKDRKSAATSFHLIVTGEGGVGKSCYTIRLCTGQYIEDFDPTIGARSRLPC